MTGLPERFARLPAWLAETLGADAGQIRRFEKLTGGAVQENWRIEVGPPLQRWVLRTDAASAVEMSHDRAQEYAVLETVHAAGICAPAPVALCEDPDLIGAPFYLMAWVDGVSPARRITRDPERPQYGPALAHRLGAELARLHAIQPPEPRLGFLAVPSGHPAQARIERYRGYLDSIDAANPALEYALNWLEDRKPEPFRLALCHSDYRTGNYLVRDGALAAVLDWEMATWSEPHEDLGWFTARCWRFGNDSLEAGGIAPLERFCAGYESVAGAALDRAALPYWQVMAEVRWAVLALLQADRNDSGREVSLELALTGRMVAEMEWNALSLISRIEAAEK